jgi:hypothetical protein
MHEVAERRRAVRLRRLVLDHKASEHRLRFPPLLQAGSPGRVLWRCTEPPGPGGGLDLALRCDALAAVLHQAARTGADEDALVWLTRAGDLAVQDVDLDWLRAVTTVNAETGRRLAFVVVTRQGWHDPRTGERRTWRRLRDR